MKNNFLDAVLRLKAQLGVASDKDLAGFLGMTPTALNQRKVRDSFPEKELLVLAAKRPELNIDVTYVLTGLTMNSALAEPPMELAEIEFGTLHARYAKRLQDERQRKPKQTIFSMALLGGVPVEQYRLFETGAEMPNARFLETLHLNGRDGCFVLTGERLTSTTNSAQT